MNIYIVNDMFEYHGIGLMDDYYCIEKGFLEVKREREKLDQRTKELYSSRYAKRKEIVQFYIKHNMMKLFQVLSRYLTPLNKDVDLSNINNYRVHDDHHVRQGLIVIGIDPESCSNFGSVIDSDTLGCPEISQKFIDHFGPIYQHEEIVEDISRGVYLYMFITKDDEHKNIVNGRFTGCIQYDNTYCESILNRYGLDYDTYVYNNIRYPG
jgi:hypothetical protein